jgi:hypothetical protein
LYYFFVDNFSTLSIARLKMSNSRTIDLCGGTEENHENRLYDVPAEIRAHQVWSTPTTSGKYSPPWAKYVSCTNKCTQIFNRNPGMEDTTWETLAKMEG